MASEAPHSNLTERSIALIMQEAPPDERRSRLRALIRDAERELEDDENRDAAFVVTLTHERLGLRHVGVSESESLRAGADLTEIALTLIEQASTKAARDTISYDSYDSQDEYEAAVERRSRTFQIVSLTRKTDPERWHVRGSGPNGSFEMDVQAATAGDAEFQARWDRAAAQGGMVTRDTATEHLAVLFEIAVQDVVANPVTLRELYDGVVAALGQGPDAAAWNPQISPGADWDRLRAQIGKLSQVFGTATSRGTP